MFSLLLLPPAGLLALLRPRAAGVRQCPAEEELDLPVQAPQVVVRPPLHRLQDGRVDAKKERFALHLIAFVVVVQASRLL